MKGIKAPFLNRTSNIWAENRLLKFSLVVLTTGVVLSSYFSYRAVQYQRTIVIPPEMTGTIEFVKGVPSNQYIEDMGRRIAHLGLTFSPPTARANFERLLSLYAPEDYPEAQRVWTVLASRVEDTLVSNVFYLKNIKVEPKRNRIVLLGERKQFAEDRVIANSNMKYVVTYRITDGRFYIKSILEGDQDSQLSKEAARNRTEEGS